MATKPIRSTSDVPGLVTALEQSLKGESGRDYFVVACVLQNDGTGQWEPIEDATHRPTNVASVVTTTNKIELTYAKTAAKVVSMVVCPDEMLATQGYSAGASVGTSLANIYIGRTHTISGYVSHNGTSWSVTGGTGNLAYSSFSGANGFVTLTHDSIGSGYGKSVTGRDGTLVPFLGSSGATSTTIRWLDWAGTVQTTANANMKAYLNLTSGPTMIDPLTFDPSGGNLWVFGIFEE